MLNDLKLGKILFFDVETVCGIDHYDQLPDIMKELWEKKAKRLIEDGEEISKSYFERAGIYAEFGKVVCISVGYLTRDANTDNYILRIRSFASDDERTVLMQFKEMLDKHYNTSQHLLCGHNIKEFDIPYLCRRMLVHGVELPKIMDIAGKKPWEVAHVDTLQLWKFGDYKSYTSLKLLAAIFDIPTPKDDIDGSDVGRVYWKEQDLNRIVIYCQKDVLTVARLLLKFMGKKSLTDKQVQIIN